MPNYTLELELFSSYLTNVPGFEIWADGVKLGATYSVTSGGYSISVMPSYGGALPSSLEFRFSDASGETPRSVEIRSVKINDKYVNTGNYLSSDSLTNGQTSTVDIGNADYIFDSSDPATSEFTTGATQTFTGGNDTYMQYSETVDQVFDMLGGRDVAVLGSGDDKVNGGAGNDVIRGGGGNDLLFGDSGNDRLIGGNGHDRLFGGSGNDRIQGDAGDDEIHGGDGNDRLSGNDGDDIITGGDGDDKISGGNGTNIIYGDAGDDIIQGGINNDTIDGGDDNDSVYGGGGTDIVNGGDGDDFLYGENGNDTLSGDEGDDFIAGQTGDDTLNGGAGRDDLYGGDGIDTLNGDDGNDDLFGGNGNDILNGGAGADSLNGSDGADTLNGGDGDDVIFGDDGAINFESGLLVIEAENYENKVDRSGKGWDIVSDAAASGGKVVVAGPNTGTIYASTGIEDTSPELNYTVNFTTTGTFYVWIKSGVASGGSNDSVHLGFDGVQQTGNGGVQTGSNYGWHNTETGTGTVVTVNVTTTGNHTLNLWMREDGAPIDKLIIADSAVYTPTGVGPDQTTRTSVTGGVDTIDGGDGNDTIYGDLGNDIISGGNDDDILSGGAGNDTIDGGNDDDTLFGNDGNDILNGGSGNDTIYGGDGDNVINGDAGDDTIYSSDSAAAVTDMVADILAANAGVTYNASTGNFYQWISSGTNMTKATAVGAVGGNTLNGVSAHLVTITSAEEQTQVGNLVTTNWAWVDGTDSATEGTFLFESGPEAGMAFDNSILNWYGGSPASTNTGARDDVILWDGGGDTLYVWPNAYGYVAEWEGNDVLGTGTITVSISGGDGSDTLYGTDGIQDIFEFGSGETGTDTIENFTSADADAIDISDLLTGYTAGVSDINEFIRFNNSGGNTIVQVDNDGGADSFTTIATINGVNDLDADALLYNQSIIA